MKNKKKIVLILAVCLIVIGASFDMYPITGAVNSVNLSDGKGKYYSDLQLLINYRGPEFKEIYDSAGRSLYQADYYDLEFVDDIMDIMTTDGKLRQLDYSEYNFTSVEIPANKEIKNSNGLPVLADTYDVEIYYRRKGDPEGYNSEGYFPNRISGTYKITDERQTVKLPVDDAVGVQIFIREFKESVLDYTTFVRCNYVFHIDDKDIASIMTDGGQIYNNMFFRLWRSWQGDYEWFNVFGRSNYGDEDSGDSDSNAQFNYDRDMRIYGDHLNDGNPNRDEDEWALDREEAILPVVEILNEFRLTSTLISLDEERNAGSKNVFYFTGSMSAEFTLGEGTKLTDFSIYTIIPEGLRLEELYNQPDDPEDPQAAEYNKYILDALSFKSDNVDPAVLAQHVKIRIVDDPDHYNGRQMIEFRFDFNDDPVTMKTLSISGLPMYVNKSTLKFGTCSYELYAEMLVHQNGKWNSNGVDNRGMEGGIWSDIDRDGDTSETASFNSGSVTINYSESTQVALTKFVETPLTDGKVNPTPDSGNITAMPRTYSGGDYWYYLYAYLGSGSITNIIFTDVIEAQEDKVIDSEWQGTFVDVDRESIDKITADLQYPNGYEAPVIYYSDKEIEFEKDDKNHNIVPANYNFEAEGWTTLKPEVVRSVAVYFGSGIATTGNVLELKINMTAPTDSANYRKLAKNACSIGYDKIDTEIDQDGNVIPGDTVYTHDYLGSNIVPVNYVPDGRILLIKEDSENGKAISGAEFELYMVKDGEDDELIGTYEVDENGRLNIVNLAYATYYLVETRPPKGYKKGNRTDDITLSYDEKNVTAYWRTIEYENDRLPGQFTIMKISDRNSSALLSGAEFWLYKLNESTMTYERIRENETLVTDENGLLTISDLEWGSYYLWEETPPTGYEIIEDNRKIDFFVNADNNVVDTNEEDPYVVINKQIPAVAKLVKHELNSGNMYTWGINDENTADVTETEFNDKELVPGDTRDKNPTIKAVKGDSYMRVIVSIQDQSGEVLDGVVVGLTGEEKAAAEALELERLDLILKTIYFDPDHGTENAKIKESEKYSLAQLNTLGLKTVNETNFKLASGNAKGVYTYEYINSETDDIFKDGTEAVLFTNIVIPTEWNQSHLKKLGEYKIVIQAQAIQAANFEDAAGSV